MNIVGLFGVNDRNDDRAQKAERHEPLLPIREAIVLIGVRHAVENLFRVDEVKAMLLQVSPPLRLVPCDHLWSVYTLRIFVKRRSREGLTPALSRAERSEGTPSPQGEGRRLERVVGRHCFSYRYRRTVERYCR